ncbi:MAG: C4-dicarboxylate transporter DctA [Aldersonia sp.]|nr:C4-dicarboxylate transporter DctA [Aldersonia sp.]
MQSISSAEDYQPPIPTKKRWYKQLYFWVLTAIVLGILVGWLAPTAGVAMEPIGTTFVTAMKMLIGPIVFLTIVGGIASVADLRRVGMTGVKALTYFQVGTIIAMVTGLVAINIFRLGDGVNADPSTIETSESAQKLITTGETKQWWEFLTHLVPESVVAPFVEGDILQIIFMAVIFGVALNAVGHAIGGPVLDLINRLTQITFKILNYIMKLAPLGAFGAMAYAIGKYGVSTLTSLGSLILLFYVTSALFVVVVLGSVMAYLRLNIFSMLKYLREELLLILGTSTAEPALPGLMRKLEYAGVSKPTVGLVVPTGYSFNLDGAAIYLSLAALYIAQATNTDLTIGQQLGLLAVMLLTSKGAAGVAGGGFIALTATLSTIGHIPAVGIMLIFGIDKFMSECRALVNFIGNAVATLFVAKWNRELDVDRARRAFAGEVLPPPAGETENDFDMEILEHERPHENHHPADNSDEDSHRNGPRGDRHDVALGHPAAVREDHAQGDAAVTAPSPSR